MPVLSTSRNATRVARRESGRNDGKYAATGADRMNFVALQSIILPLVFLWLFAEALKKIAARSTQL